MIMMAGVGQVCIGKDQFLATNRIETRSFEADLIHSAAFVVHNSEIANFKWAVEKDHKVGKQIGKDGLASQGNGNTADSQACHDGRDVIRSEEHTSELQSLMRTSPAVFF